MMAGMMGSKRTVLLAVAIAATVAIAAAVALVVLASAVKPAGAATDQLPDLSMARIVDLQIKNCTDTKGDCAYVDQRQLRFATRIVNVGAGPFEAEGSSPAATGILQTVTQHIYDDQGTFRSVSTKVGNDGSTAQMYYAGDGHNHWHLKNLEHYTLSSSPVSTGAKEGFCFYDNVKWFKKDASGNPRTPGVPSSPVYTNCANNQPSATSVTVGLSRGWGDKYGSKTIDQYIDITGLPDGSYRLTTTADEHDWFYESNETNNSTWAELNIQGNTVSVTSYGSSNPPRV
jgi:lysyl oxidase